MAGKKSKKDGESRKRKRGRDTPVSVEPSDDEGDVGNANGAVPSAAAVDIEKKAEKSSAEDEYGAKDFRSEMELRPDHEVSKSWALHLA